LSETDPVLKRSELDPPKMTNDWGLIYARIRVCRGRGDSEAEVLEEVNRSLSEDLKFRSPEAMYSRLRHELERRNFSLEPDGMRPKEQGHPPAEGGHKRRPKPGMGRMIELPRPSAAENLFREALEELHCRIVFVNGEKGWLQGTKRFITVASDPNAREVKERHMFSEEEWKELCEQYGVPPTEEILVIAGDLDVPEGVKIAPSNELVSLIAAYALTDLPLDPLLAAVHPGSPSVEERQLVQEATDKLKKVAEYLARRVRGGVVGKGTNIVEVPLRDHFLAWDRSRYSPRRCRDNPHPPGANRGPIPRSLSPDHHVHPLPGESSLARR
jgi:hypothetical protein